MNQKEMEKFVWQALGKNVRGRIYEDAESRIMRVSSRWHGTYFTDKWLTEAETRRLQRAIESVRKQVSRRGE